MRRLWPFSIRIDRLSSSPVGQQIVHAVIDEIRSGRLKAGTLLPGSRELADSLSVNRKTVVTAFAELQAQGWLDSESRRGTFVAENLPTLKSRHAKVRTTVAKTGLTVLGSRQNAARISVDLPPAGMVCFDDGAPELRQVPVDALARAYRDGLRSTLQRRRLGYGDPRGSEVLRASIAAMLSAERGLAGR